ncbi:hypothetical protein MPH_02776 [Macrophomina phaseolina MS6]|uniref:Uncharacterized protein n=1 Tax=Macrophomina phaseolina (strain MS6) TaxID=1126212 RepID=K2RYY6_MACPH|nr:hypothetical protein MPH_02776 [Macrophomina phaseolina MS6]
MSSESLLNAFHATPLNYRHTLVARGLFPIVIKDKIVTGSDGANEVVAAGHRVTLPARDRVMTIFNQGHFAGPPNSENVSTTLGTVINDALRQYYVFSQDALVHIPRYLD